MISPASNGKERTWPFQVRAIQSLLNACYAAALLDSYADKDSKCTVSCSQAFKCDSSLAGTGPCRSKRNEQGCSGRWELSCKPSSMGVPQT